ncbi:hypothetical protein LK10_01565 [Sinomonas humi]|uniref:Uncharacterized protein n=1 Tax=Sinomonas humi TaxID=1338436 RepID=A0A0B2ATM2_9MICC|nr:hypothetical protein LK10_01565 [Sinomonas humi]
MLWWFGPGLLPREHNGVPGRRTCREEALCSCATSRHLCASGWGRYGTSTFGGSGVPVLLFIIPRRMEIQR